MFNVYTIENHVITVVRNPLVKFFNSVVYIIVYRCGFQ